MILSPAPVAAGTNSVQGRLDFLDGLRGVAALMVALCHYVAAFQPAMLSGEAAAAHFPASLRLSSTALVFFWNPGLGVSIFFVLSGFVLAAATTARPAPFPELALRRWIRLSLPILATSLLVWPLAAFGLFVSPETGLFTRSAWLRQHFAWFPAAPHGPLDALWQSFVGLYAWEFPSFNTALWTMPIEFWGSLGLFLAYRCLVRIGARGWQRLIAAIGAFALLWAVQRTGHGLIWGAHYASFALGTLLFELRRLPVVSPTGLKGLVPTRWLAGTFLVLGAFLLGGVPYAVDTSGNGFYFPVITALGRISDSPVFLMHQTGAFCAVAAALVFGPLQRVLAGRACQFLGRVSFMAYLLHIPLLCSLFAAVIPGLAAAIGYNTATLLLLPFYLALVLALASLLTRIADRPAIRLAQRAGAILGALAPPGTAIALARRMRVASPAGAPETASSR